MKPNQAMQLAARPPHVPQARDGCGTSRRLDGPTPSIFPPPTRRRTDSGAMQRNQGRSLSCSTFSYRKVGLTVQWASSGSKIFLRFAEPSSSGCSSDWSRP